MSLPDLIETDLPQIDDPDRAKWLADRSTYIGGSDIAAIMGLSKYKTAYGMWLEKTGQAQPQEDNEFTYWGRELEDLVASEFSRRTGKRIERHEQTVRLDGHYYIAANVDRLIPDEQAVLECKTASAYLEKTWDAEGVPLNYQAQVQWYMGILGLDDAYIAVLFGGNKFRVYHVEADGELFAEMVEIAREWWVHYIEGDNIHEVDGSHACAEALSLAHPQSTQETIVIHDNDPILPIIDQLREAKEEIDKWTEVKNYCENKLKTRMGEAAKMDTPRGKVSWGNVKGRTTFDAKRFRKDYPVIADEYTKVGNPTRRFAFTAIDQE